MRAKEPLEFWNDAMIQNRSPHLVAMIRVSHSSAATGMIRRIGLEETAAMLTDPHDRF